MKITIDTKDDSEKDIKRAIALLQQYIGETASTSYADNSSDMPPAGAFNIFGDDSGTKDAGSDGHSEEDDNIDDSPKVQIIDF